MVRLLPTLLTSWVIIGIGWQSQLSPLNVGERPNPLLASVPKAEAQALDSSLQAQTQTTDPVRVRIPVISVDAPVVGVDLNAHGIVDTPNAEVGWYQRSAKMGQAGAIVLSGHFVGIGVAQGVFHGLGSVKVGDRIDVEGQDGRVDTYEVFETETVSTSEFPTRKVYGKKDGKLLHLITCAGSYSSQNRTYSQRTLVYAKQAE